jgi:hypothetical protein
VPDNKKHHYVPAFYLRRFSTDQKSVNLYNIPSSRRVLHASLKNQCYRNRMYGADPTMERALAQLETITARLFREIDSRVDLPPPFTEAHGALMLHLLMQGARTQFAADVIDEMHDTLVRTALGPQFEAEGIDLSKIKFGLQDPAAISLSIATQLYPMLIDLQTKLLINRTDADFVTSDNPVAQYNQLLSFRTHGSNCGWAAKGLQIFLPLDPRKTLVAYDPIAYRVGRDGTGVVDLSLPQDVYELNTLQACSASANIYFRSEMLDSTALHRKARPFLRQRKTRSAVFHKRGAGRGAERSEIVASSREDIRTNLSLSFLSIRSAAKKWQQMARAQRMQPGSEVRSEQLLNAFNKFREEVKAGRYTHADFFRFAAEHDADDFKINPTSHKPKIILRGRIK